MKRVPVAIAITIMLCGSLPIQASDATPTDTYIDEEYIGYIEEVCEEYCICPELIEAMIESESHGDPDARSKCDARGLMQIIPKYRKAEMEELGITDLYDPRQNIELGVYIVSNLAEEYEDLYAVLMAYNEGEYSGAVERAEEGKWSAYAKRVVSRSRELEMLHGK